MMVHILSGLLSGRSYIHPSQTDSDYQTLMAHNIKIASDYADAILKGSNEDLAIAVANYERAKACKMVGKLAEVFESRGDTRWRAKDIAYDLRGLADKIRVGE